MAHPATQPHAEFTYADYLTWPDEERWEIIDGVAYDMTPPPLRVHQRILLRLAFFLEGFFEGKSCEVNISPFDVRIPEKDEEDEKIRTVVQPDISVVCNPEKLDDQGCRGAPDLVIEILSPSTASYDAIVKRRRYERAGVKEYWLVDPANRIVTALKRQPDGTFGRVAYSSADDHLATDLFPGLDIDLSRVFPPLPPRVVRNSPRSYNARSD